MQYPPGVPGEVAVDTYASLVPLLEESWTRYAKRDALACMGVRVTYGEIDERSRSLGAWLQAQGFVDKGFTADAIIAKDYVKPD